jgi:predicted nucleotidyltransferase
VTISAFNSLFSFKFHISSFILLRMGLSRKHLSENAMPVHFDPERLASVLKEQLPEAEFCLLMGSATAGAVKAFSDIDLAFYLDGKPSYSFYRKVMDAVRSAVPDVRCDIGILNSAEPVYRFEALKGQLLFTRDQERYVTFFSRTCREYESQMLDYERQRRYRRACRGEAPPGRRGEAAHAV